jgi:hypothetical protein
VIVLLAIERGVKSAEAEPLVGDVEPMMTFGERRKLVEVKNAVTYFDSIEQKFEMIYGDKK